MPTAASIPMTRSAGILPRLTQYSMSWRLHWWPDSVSLIATAEAEPLPMASSSSIPLMPRSIANIPCGASMPCGDLQGLLAYPRVMARAKKAITEADRAIGGRIRAARERLGVTVTDLGLAFGGKRQTAQFWERGAHFPPASDLKRLCQLLRIDANHLLGIQHLPLETERDVESARRALLAEAQRARLAQKETTARTAPTKIDRRRTA